MGGECGEVQLRSAGAVESFARFVARWTERASVDGIDEEAEGDDSDEEVGEDDEDVDEDDTDDSNDEFHSVNSRSPTPSPPAPATPSDEKPVLRIRRLAFFIPPSQLSKDFPTTSLLSILSAAAASLVHLHIAYAETLLAHDPRIPSALVALSSISDLVLSELGPKGCETLKSLTAPLEHVEVDFDDAWVESVTCASFAKPTSSTLVPALPNGESSGLPTPAPTPATTPAAPYANTVLPDPVPLLSHSMATLRSLRASNAIIVTVADKLRYPCVRTLALRLAGVPTVTPLVHAFPSVTDLYVYTPFDGCGLRAPLSLPMSSHAQLERPPSPSPSPTSTGNHHKNQNKNSKRRMRPPMPDIHATREANRTSQVYSSFPPLACVRGFAPGLYALGLSCAVHRLEIGSMSPPSLGGQEAGAVRKLLADTMPASVNLGLGRGWWGSEWRRERTRGRERGLKAIFGSASSEEANASGAWSGVSELVVRVEEPGRWKHVTNDLLVMILPLANTLTTFVLHWDRTSVPFDRASSDDDRDDYQFPPPSPSASAPSRTERFARTVAEQMPALRYLLVEILHDRRRPPYAFNFDAVAKSNSPLSGHGVHDDDGQRRYERRFWRIDRSEEFLCLDPLSEGAARRLMEAEGLTFEDRVRYR
ncbi:hypothetical protein L227DRAFT_497385 [Lentinus tigrinus ALCF2SS1-6]|uniref:Uncharacterized protein n=1 Tax=Lentinus tigrinus ALCF2SS1-6 TaxID=1328759 RepID=A0A5C2SIL3_9APHY|nr:hypothetical protein L227DRAFT_497385 [Lentinus tigrinus ALCF2SS1-6]